MELEVKAITKTMYTGAFGNLYNTRSEALKSLVALELIEIVARECNYPRAVAEEIIDKREKVMNLLSLLD